MRRSTVLAGAAISIAAPLIVAWEGMRHKPYLDVVGVPTVCAGITGPDVDMGKIYTADECAYLNEKHIMKHAAAVERLIAYPLPAETKAAVISWTYNLGEGNLARSTMRRKFNAGDLRGGCDEMLKWVYAGGKKLRGLERRRKAERKLCLEGLHVQ